MVHHPSAPKEKLKMRFSRAIQFIFFVIFLYCFGCQGMRSEKEGLSQPVPESQIEINRWCSEVRSAVTDLKWNMDPCEGIRWVVGGVSVYGRPLVFVEYGPDKSPNTTLVFATVHGDEITPLYLGLELARYMRDQEKKLGVQKDRVVIVPLVNPDGFFSHPRRRMNANGVDLNRNFLTLDWRNSALLSWKRRFRSDPRRFPGNEANSEPETKFQAQLILRMQPQKILSIHSPLNFLDYDGPSRTSLKRFSEDYAQICDRLKQTLKATSGGVFPGSLGKYAGRELGIPTLTLELPSADPRHADVYWKQFKSGIHHMIRFSIPQTVSRFSPAGSGG